MPGAVPIATSRLLALFRDAVTDDVQVTLLSGRDLKRKCVVFSGTADWDVEWAAIGPEHPQDDVFSLEIWVDVNLSKRSAEDAFNEVFVIHSALERALESDRTLDGLLKVPAQLAMREARPYGTPEGVGAFIRGAVRCRARV